MVLYGYDAAVFNAVQGSKNWIAWFDKPGLQLTGAINTAYTVGAIFGGVSMIQPTTRFAELNVSGFFMGGPIADFAGRKIGMATGAAFVIMATFMQTFSPWHNIGVFIAGRVFIGIGQGIALSMSSARTWVWEMKLTNS